MMRYMYFQYTIHMYSHVDQMSNLKVITNHPKVISKVALTLLSSTYVPMQIRQVGFLYVFWWYMMSTLGIGLHQIVLLCKPYQEEYIFKKCSKNAKNYFCLVTWDQIDIVMWFLSYLSSQEPISIWFDGFELCNTKYSTNANLKHLDVFVTKYNLWIANVGEIVK